ncbi:MAG: hypothetical protein GF344_14750 [Chitinivibrionales bacterium]|nr:hypothetical protein [Chitinivibrionales bacterium]
MNEEHPFRDFEPVLWQPGRNNESDEGFIYSVTRNHGVSSSYRLHNPRDEINEGRNLLDKVILEYRIGRISYDLFTIRDCFEADYALDPCAGGNIVGDLAERIARRITKYFLKHFSKNGYTGGIFDKRFNPAERDGFIVTHTDDYLLKIQNYPNLVILKRSGRGKYGYENIKELDGLFDYRYRGNRHILVLESKVDRINVDCDDLVDNLFRPLEELFPEARFSYVLFSDETSIFVKKNFRRRRRLKQLPVRIYERLRREGIGLLCLTFNENTTDFERMRDHLITQYRSVVRLGVTMHGKMVVSPRCITLFDGGETPHLKLMKDMKHGMWREVKLTHKKKRCR